MNRFARLSKPETWRVSTVKLLFALILLFAVTPFIEDLPNGDFVESGLITLVMVASLVAVGRDHRVLISGAVLLVPAIAGKWLNHFFPDYISPFYFPIFGIAFFAFTIDRILRFILQTTHVDTEILSAGIVVYLMLGILWAQAYTLLAQLTPDTFHFPLGEHSERHMGGFNAFYFSFSTLTTVGFGDITPMSKIARTLAVVEAVTGTLYLAILISRLVGMYSPSAGADLSEDSKKR
jgi:voltage-gated potassium channel